MESNNKVESRLARKFPKLKSTALFFVSLNLSFQFLLFIIQLAAGSDSFHSTREFYIVLIGLLIVTVAIHGLGFYAIVMERFIITSIYLFLMILITIGALLHAIFMGRFLRGLYCVQAAWSFAGTLFTILFLIALRQIRKAHIQVL